MFNSGNGSTGAGDGATSFQFGKLNSTANINSNSGSNLFGSLNSNSGTQSGSSGLFGQANNSANPSGQSNTLDPNKNTSGLTNSGTGSSSGLNSQPTTSNAPGPSGNNIFGQLGSQQSSKQNSGLSMFGGNGLSTSNKGSMGTPSFSTFGTNNTNSLSSNQGSSNTDPNTENKTGSVSLFGSNSVLETSNSTTSGSLFGNKTAQQPAAPNAEKPAASSGFSFGFNNNAASSGSLFGGQNTHTPAGSENANASAAKPGASLFSSLGGNAATSTTPTAKPSLFGNPAAAEKKEDAKAPTGFSLGAGFTEKKDQAPTSNFAFGLTNNVDQTKPALGGGFSFGGTATENKAENKPVSGTSFGNSLKKSSDNSAKEDSTKPLAADGKSAGFSFEAVSNGAPKDEARPSLSLGPKKDDVKTDAQLTSISGVDPAKLRATASVPVQPGEYLKNKSFEDIIAKWTSALSKSVDRFKEQAAETAKWDQILVDNGEKITEIYNEVTVAEQAQTRIDDVLTYVSRQQDDIDAMLSQVESQISPSNSTGFVLENLQPIDKERYEAYSLAEQLNNKVDQLQDSLGSIIDEMNELTRESHQVKESDPVSQIVKILNAHLGSLQFIDESANELHKKLVEAHSQNSRLRI